MSFCCLKKFLARWDDLDVTFCFVGPQLSSACVSGPFRKSVSSLDGDDDGVGVLHVIVLVSLIDGFEQLSTLSYDFFQFSERATLPHLVSFCLFLKSLRGIFPCPRTLIAGNFGPNEDVRL